MTPFAAKLIQANLGVHTAFQEGVESLKQGIDLVWEFKTSTVSKPGTKETVMGFLAEMPLFKRWTGERQHKSVAVGSHTVVVEDFEVSFKLQRDDIKYDRLGLLKPTIAGYGIAQQRFPSDLVNDFQNAGKTKKCFDGQNFYDSSHPKGLDGTGGTFTNLNTATPLTPANLWAKYEYMTQITDGNGKRFGIRPNILEYGPGLAEAVRFALSAEEIGIAVSSAGAFGGTSSVVGATAVSNTAMGLVTPQYNPDLETGVWYLHDTRIMKPFLYMIETPPTGLITRDRLDDPHVWNFKEFLYGAEATAAATCTLPHLSQRNEVA